MLRKKILLFIAAAFIFSSFLQAYEAQAKWGRGFKDRGRSAWGTPGGSPNCFAGVDLTPEQRVKLNNMRAGIFKDSVSIRSDIYAKRLELNSLLLDQEPDVEKAKKVQGELSSLKGKLAQKRLLSRVEARKVLTPDQIAQLPPGCGMGFAKMRGPIGRGFRGGCGPRYGADMWD